MKQEQDQEVVEGKYWQCLRCDHKFLMPRMVNCQGHKFVKVLDKCPECGWHKLKFVNKETHKSRFPEWL